MSVPSTPSISHRPQSVVWSDFRLESADAGNEEDYMTVEQMITLLAEEINRRDEAEAAEAAEAAADADASGSGHCSCGCEDVDTEAEDSDGDSDDEDMSDDYESADEYSEMNEDPIAPDGADPADPVH